ncbi:MAG: hypothetical protein ACT4OM_10465 [Actinomycetota bacterium]
MEIDGHPTHDLVDELRRRGGQLHLGNSLGPMSSEVGGGLSIERGLWLFLPEKAYDTDIDEPPPLG